MYRKIDVKDGIIKDLVAFRYTFTHSILLDSKGLVFGTDYTCPVLFDEVNKKKINLSEYYPVFVFMDSDVASMQSTVSFKVLLDKIINSSNAEFTLLKEPINNSDGSMCMILLSKNKSIVVDVIYSLFCSKLYNTGEIDDFLISTGFPNVLYIHQNRQDKYYTMEVGDLLEEIDCSIDKIREYFENNKDKVKHDFTHYVSTEAVYIHNRLFYTEIMNYIYEGKNAFIDYDKPYIDLIPEKTLLGMCNSIYFECMDFTV